jgi:hypothetical protein
MMHANFLAQLESVKLQRFCANVKHAITRMIGV